MTRIKAVLVFCLYRFLMLTWRVRLTASAKTQALMDQGAPIVLAHWHGDELALIHLVKRLSLATMTSQSKDGQIVESVIRWLGGTSTKGSSSKGGAVGLLGLVKLLRSGRMTSVAVDGPRGPRHIVKPGVFELAKLGSANIVPVGVACHSAIRFPRSWNQTYLPYPFARIDIIFADPVPHLSPEFDPRSIEGHEDLALRLNAAGRAAANSIAAP